MLAKRMKEIIPKIILKRPFPLKIKTKERGKSTASKIARLFGVPIVLKEENFVKSNGKRKIL